MATTKDNCKSDVEAPQQCALIEPGYVSGVVDGYCIHLPIPAAPDVCGHDIDDDLPEISNSYDLVVEAQERDAILAEDAKLKVMQHPKVKTRKREPKRYKKKATRATVDISSVSPSQKKKWIEMGIYHSASQAFDKSWMLRPNNYKKEHIPKWENWCKKFDVQVSDILQLHFYPAHMLPGKSFGYIEMKQPNFKAIFAEQPSFDALYEDRMTSHLVNNDHHPETSCTSPDADTALTEWMTTQGTIELMCDLWACAMRYTTSWKEAYKMFFDWIADVDCGVVKPKPKFVTMCPVGLAMFYAGMFAHGIPQDSWAFAKAARDQFAKPLTTKAAKFDWNQKPTFKHFRIISQMDEFKYYQRDTRIHCALVNFLVRRWGIHVQHDVDKWNWDSLVAYTYNWVIKPKLVVPTSDTPCPLCSNPFCSNRSDTGQCAVDQSFFERAQQSCSEFFSRVKTGVASGVQKIIPEQLKSLVISLQGQLKELGTITQSMLSKIMSIIKPLLRWLGLDDLDVSQSMWLALDIVRYYIIYINTTSTVIHGLCIYAILSALGIVHAVTNVISNWFGEDESVPSTSGENPQPTNDDSFLSRVYALFGDLFATKLSPTAVAVPLTVIAVIMFGASFKGKNFTNIGHDFVTSMRNVHFIGAGITGFVKVFDVLARAIKFVAEWVGKKFFSVVPEDEKAAEDLKALVTEYTSWAAQVDVMTEDEVVGKLCADKHVQERILNLFDRGMVYNKMRYEGSLPDTLVRDFPRLWRLIREAHNAIMRARTLADFRVTPFHLQFYGKAGVGKSTLIRKITRDIGNEFFPDITNLVYAKGNTEQYDGYNGQPIYMCDDMFPANDYKANVELLPLISNCPLLLYMSHLESKGTYFTSKFMLSTTNNPWPTFDGMFKKEPIWRRRHLLVEVSIDPDVLDESGGKFSKEKFEIKYGDVDTYTFPHLKFSLKSPVQPEVPLSDVKMPPYGIKEPTQSLSYEKFRVLMNASYRSHAAAEFKFQQDESARYQEICRQLTQFDNTYAAFKRNGDSIPTFDNNFDDGNRGVKPSPIQTPSIDPRNLDFIEELESDDDVFATFSTMFKESEGDTLTGIMLGILSTLNNLTRKPLKIKLGGLELDNFLYVGFLLRTLETNVALIPQQAQDQFVNSMQRVREWFKTCTFKTGGGKSVVWIHMTQEIWDDLVTGVVGQPLATLAPEETIPDSVLYAYSSISVMSKIFGFSTLLSADHLKQMDTMIKTALVPTPTSDDGEDVNFISSDMTDAQIEDELAGLYAEVFNQVRDMNALIQLNSTEAPAVFMSQYVNTLSDMEAPELGILVAKFQNSMVATRSSFSETDKLDIELYLLILRKLQKLQSKIITYQVELRERSLRSKVSPSKAPVNEEWGNAIFFTNDANNTALGYRLRLDCDYGVTMVDTAFCGAPAFHHTAPPELVNYASRVFMRLGEFYLTKAEWNTVFPYREYVDGNTHISIGYLQELQHFAHGNNDDWFWRGASVYDDICTRLRMKVGTLRYEITPTELCSITPEWQSDNLEFLDNCSSDQRRKLFTIFRRHNLIITLLKRLRIKASMKAKSLFASAWNRISGALSFVWNMLSEYKIVIGIGLMAGAIIGVCTGFARLFIPEATSFRPSSLFAKSRSNVVSTFTNNEIAKKATAGIVRCRVDGATFVGYKVDNHALLVPWHAVAKYKAKKGKFELAIAVSTAPVVVHLFEISYLNVSYFQNSDLALIYHDEFPAWGKRLQYIKTAAEWDVEKGPTALIVGRLPDGSFEYGECPYSGAIKDVNVRLGPGLDLTMAGVGCMECTIEVGVSGAPIFLLTSGSNSPTIAGFQSYRMGDKSYFSMVARETIASKISELSGSYPELEGPFAVSEHAEPAEATSSVIGKHLEVVGAVPSRYRVYQPSKSEFSRTKIADVFPIRKIPAILSEYDSIFDKTQGHPAAYSINKHGRGTIKLLPQDKLDQAVREYALYYKYRIRKPKLFPILEAIEGNGRMNHLDLNTSPGIPWVFHRTQKGKKDFITIDDNGKVTYLAPELVKSLQYFEAAFNNNVVPKFSMVEIMKDELRPIWKVTGLKPEEVSYYYTGGIDAAEWPSPRLCKTRTITVMPMEFTILYRRFFGDFFSQCYQLANSGTEPSCVGINADGAASATIYMRCRELNDHGFDLDVSNWDGHYSPQMFHAVARVVNLVYNDEYSNVRNSIVDGACFGHVQFRDAVYKKEWGMPSGFPGTADFNTLGHMLLGYVIWLLIMEGAGRRDLCNLTSYMSLTVDCYYGDDRLTVPDKSISNIFNGVSVSKWYEYFGYPVTSATKNHDSLLMLPLSELQFLKRRWIISPEDPLYVKWAMDKETIETLVQYIRKTFEPRQQHRENLLTALHFACDWGEEYFNQFRDQVNYYLAKTRQRPIVADFETIRLFKRANYFDITNGADPVFDSVETALALVPPLE